MSLRAPRIVLSTTVLLLGASLSLAACGQQTDDRSPTATEETTAAVTEEAPTDEAPTADAAAAPFISLDCVSGAEAPTDAPPAGSASVGDAYASISGDGVPVLTLSTSAAPAADLGYADLVVGEGAEVQPGDTVTVNYCGAGYGGLAVFDSSWSRGEPIAFPLGNLIPGWQEGIPGMKVGGQRLLVIPGPLGYGEQGAPGIAPNETLVFLIELLGV